MFLTLWPWPWDENEKSDDKFWIFHFAIHIPKNPFHSVNSQGEDRFLIWLPPKNGYFLGVAPPTMGVATPSSRKTQLDIDIEHITKFHQDRIKVHGVMLWTDRHTGRQTDRHTDITNIVVTLAGAREPTGDIDLSAMWEQQTLCLDVRVGDSWRFSFKFHRYVMLGIHPKGESSTPLSYGQRPWRRWACLAFLLQYPIMWFVGAENV